MSICQQLSEVNPTEEPTKCLGDKENGAQSPLHGSWSLLFTTAADASFSKNSTRGNAKVKNVVDARRGRITNVIEFASKEDGTEPVLKQLNVVIKAVATSPMSRIDLSICEGCLNKVVFLPIRWSLYIPVPGPFITRCIVLVYRLFTFRKTAKRPPKAFFDVLYLDDELRIHKTGEDNLFVQAKESWDEAKKYLV
ncbi:PAP fibrillin [Fragilaria crotonensis]|nr:PAP fibrillin [Fragilaria crotonensis]